jgi:hypothetical protein
MEPSFTGLILVDRKFQAFTDRFVVETTHQHHRHQLAAGKALHNL